MDSYDFVDSVKAEKANALARYRRFTNLTKLLQFIEVFVAVALISWSTTRLPLAFKLSGEYLVAFSSYLMNQHVVFLVGNVIVVVCYVLSRRSDAGNNDSGRSGIFYSEQKFNNNNNNQKTTGEAPVTVESPVTVETPVPVPVTEIRDRMIRNHENEMMKSESEVVTAELAIKQAVKQIERFQRTQSDKLKSQISMKPGRELRRSVTEKMNGGLTATSFQSVDRLSNEEFRIAVEAFISKQQSFLKQQSMVENGS